MTYQRPIRMNADAQRFAPLQPDKIAALLAGIEGSYFGRKSADTPRELRRISITTGLIPRARGSRARLLDIGGSVAWLPVYAALGYRHITLVRPSGEDFLSDIRLPEWPDVKIDSVVANAELDPYPLDDGCIDCVVCFEVLEHLAGDPMHLVAEANRLLVDGGDFCLTTPNVLDAQNLGRYLFGGHPFGWSPYTNAYADRHNREYTPGEVQILMEAGGFQIDRLTTERIHLDRTGPHRLLGMLLSIPAALTRRVSLGLRDQTTFIHATKANPVKDRHPKALYEFFTYHG